MMTATRCVSDRPAMQTRPCWPGRAGPALPSRVMMAGEGFGALAFRVARAGRTGWGDMLQVFGFDRIGVVVGDIYFIDPSPAKGQEGPEHGVRLEVRMLQPGELTGSIYSARPITVAEPVWRADLLESVDGPVGSFNRTHHHPHMSGWEPGHRVFDRELSGDPVGWVGRKLSDLEGLLGLVGIEVDEALAGDADQLREAVPEIERAVTGMLEQVHAGQLGTAPDGDQLTSARVSWL